MAELSLFGHLRIYLIKSLATTSNKFDNAPSSDVLCIFYSNDFSADMAKGLRVLELFSGIGGMHHALDLVGDVEVKADD